MKSEEIKSRFKKVSDEVQANSTQMEQDVKSKVAAIRDDAVKKFGSAIN
jgi:hypothetical protein